ncbi:hypothetical protein Tco_0013965 [Tanacetum coccineum]
MWRRLRELGASAIWCFVWRETLFGDLDVLIKDIEASEDDELLSGMTNDKRMVVMDALGVICDSIKAGNSIPGASAKDQPKGNSNFRPLVADLVFDGVNIFIPRKVVRNGTNWAKHGLKRIMMNTKGFFFFKFDTRAGLEAAFLTYTAVDFKKEKPIMLSMNGSRPGVIYKKRKGKSNSINGGQLAGPSVKQPFRYEPTTTTGAPKKGAINVGNASKSSSMLKTAGTSSKKDNITMSNSYSALNDEEEDEEEDVENVYDESANLFLKTKIGGSSSSTAACSVESFVLVAISCL